MSVFTHGLEVAQAIARLRPNGQVIEHPQRLVQWEKRKNPALTIELSALIHGVKEIGDTFKGTGTFVAIEDICRVMIGGESGMRGSGERFTALVVHVISDAEPSRTVILPLE